MVKVSIKIDYIRKESDKEKNNIVTLVLLIDLFLFISSILLFLLLKSFEELAIYISIVFYFTIFARSIVQLMRSGNYYDKMLPIDDVKLWEKVKLITNLWINSLVGFYPIVLEDSTEIYMGNGKECKPDISCLIYRFHFNTLYPMLLGFIELYVYPWLLITHHIDYIWIYIGFKTIAQWDKWKTHRSSFYTYLIGNVLIVLAAFLLASWFNNTNIPFLSSIEQFLPSCKWGTINCINNY